MSHNKPTSQTLSLPSVPYSSSAGSLPYLTGMNQLSNQQIINELRRIINEQQIRLMQFNQLLAQYLDKIAGIQNKYQDERQYSDKLKEKLDQARSVNEKLEIQLKLLKSDNIILKSKLGYDNSSSHSRIPSDTNINQNMKQQLQIRDVKIKEWESKMNSIRNVIKHLLGVFQQVITHNQQQQRMLMDGVTQLMGYIK